MIETKTQLMNGNLNLHLNSKFNKHHIHTLHIHDEQTKCEMSIWLEAMTFNDDEHKYTRKQNDYNRINIKWNKLKEIKIIFS